MACIALPLPTLPTLSLGLTLGLDIPQFSFDPILCCKILPFPLVTPPIPLPTFVFNPAVIATINTYIAAINAYHDALSFDCPLEGSIVPA